MVAYKIDEIEGIGPVYRTKLHDVGISSTDDLLDLCSKPAGRKEIATKTGISEKQILGWANMADLMRVSGVGRQYAEPLEASGVDTIKELRHRNADSLAKAMKGVNEQKHLAKSSPSSDMVADWIAQAGKIDPKIEY